MKYVQKIDRTCYIRITQVLRYEQAERMCRSYDLQPAVIDNIRLLNKLRQLNMCSFSIVFNKCNSMSHRRCVSILFLVDAKCKGACPTAKGFYIGLKRLPQDDVRQPSKWMWSTNETWLENTTKVIHTYLYTHVSNVSIHMMMCLSQVRSIVDNTFVKC
jgi:hypothetical protein